ncbi:hypothetical protein EBX93_16165, partial [bacterium]|nr:hypothetical protein [bacterium]
VHGIADTAALATKTYADTAASNAQSAAESTASSALSSHESDTTDIHGIANTAALATKTYAENAASLAQTAAESNAQSDATNQISIHNSDTTNVHGIANTQNLATQDYVDSAVSSLGNTADETYIPLTYMGENNGVATLDSNGHVQIEQISVSTTNVSEGTNLYFTDARAQSAVGNSFVAGTNLSKDFQNEILTVNLDNDITLTGNVTADEIFSNAITVDGDASVDNLTVGGNLTVNGTTTTVNATDLSVTDPMIYMGDGNQSNSLDLGIVAAFNDGTYQHSGLVKDATDGVWKLFRGVTDEPTSTINFSQAQYETLKLGSLQSDSAAIGDVSNQEIQYLNGTTSNIQDQLDDKAPSNSPTFTGTVTLPNDSIVTSFLNDGAVTTDKIFPDAITTSTINNLAVTTAKIDALAVTTAKINDLAVTTGKINDAAITTEKINDGAVTTDKISLAAITDTKLATDSVTTVKILDSAVTTAKINDAAVTADKLAAD